MLVPVELRRAGERWCAACRLLPDCAVEAGDPGVALARLRLALEAEIARRLGRDEPLPEFGRGAGTHQIHINLRHLQALAAHQQGRWD
ncbi:MAG: hypothetical protein D6727_07900 [Gammaproteobacteria bacterium]|nr:MAG: hypothetical protein D6727_07900 [Gammaproteobacteria bacterium]